MSFAEDFFNQIVGVHWGPNQGEAPPNSQWAYVITNGDRVGSASARGYTYPYGSADLGAGVGGPGGWNPLTKVIVPYNGGWGDGYFADGGGLENRHKSFVAVVTWHAITTPFPSYAGGFYTDFADVNAIIKFNSKPPYTRNLSWTAVAILTASLP